MKIQWYKNEQEARVFYDVNTLYAILPNCKFKEDADMALNALGSRRKEKWQKAQWGYEASIRRK